MTGATSLPDGVAFDDTSAEGCARSFISAVVWGAHRWVWELLSVEGRDLVLRIAGRGGFDPAVMEPARRGTWSLEESDPFLANLVRGIRVDLSRVDMTAIEVSPAEPDDGGRWRVAMFTPVAFVTDVPGWPAGSVVVKRTDQGWRVDRLVIHGVETGAP